MNYDHLSSPQPRKVRIPEHLKQLDEEQKQRLEKIIAQYDSAVSKITAKDISKFKALNGKGPEL